MYRYVCANCSLRALGNKLELRVLSGKYGCPLGHPRGIPDSSALKIAKLDTKYFASCRNSANVAYALV